jgi:hypothetical protein
MNAEKSGYTLRPGEWADGVCLRCGCLVVECASDRNDADYMNRCTNDACPNSRWHHVGDMEILDYYQHRGGEAMSADTTVTVSEIRDQLTRALTDELTGKLINGCDPEDITVERDDDDPSRVHYSIPMPPFVQVVHTFRLDVLDVPPVGCRR